MRATGHRDQQVSYNLPNPAGVPGAQGEAGREALRAVVGAGEFFAATLPDGERLVQPIPRGARHPLNFGREARGPPTLPDAAVRTHGCVC